MSKKKLISEVSNEDLLNVLEDPNSKEQPLEKPSEHSVIQFLADFSVYPGDRKVAGVLLFKLYKYHIKNNVSSAEFHLLIQQFLKFEVINKNYYYYCNRYSEDLAKKLAEFLHKKKKVRSVNKYCRRKSFEAFIKWADLKKGRSSIDVKTLYFFYDKWHYEKSTSRAFGLRIFRAMLEEYFVVRKNKNNSSIVKISYEFIKRNRHVINTAAEWGKKFGKKKEYRKRKKKEQAE